MTEEQIKKFGIKIQNLQPDSTNYSANIIVQCFGKEDEDDKHIVHPLNFMPRKERCCELDYDLSDKGQKEKYLKQLRDSQERLKILSLLLHKQEEEVIEFGYPKTTCYYPDLNCLKEIDFKEESNEQKKAIIHINNVSKIIGTKRIKISEGMAKHIQNELCLAKKELED